MLKKYTLFCYIYFKRLNVRFLDWLINYYAMMK
jgi:hypothetical protein